MIAGVRTFVRADQLGIRKPKDLPPNIFWNDCYQSLSQTQRNCERIVHFLCICVRQHNPPSTTEKVDGSDVIFGRWLREVSVRGPRSWIRIRSLEASCERSLQRCSVERTRRPRRSPEPYRPPSGGTDKIPLATCVKRKVVYGCSWKQVKATWPSWLTLLRGVSDLIVV